jgi:hypothetical protein
MKDEDFIEPIDEARDVPGTTAEERRRRILVGQQGPHTV